MKTFPVIVLALAALGFFGFGLWLVIDPIKGLGAVHIAPTHPAGAIEMRAFYGGMEIGLGVFLAACAMVPAWREPGLWLVALANGGTVAARILGISMAGVFTPFLAGALVWELGFTAAALAAIKVLGPSAANGAVP